MVSWLSCTLKLDWFPEYTIYQQRFRRTSVRFLGRFISTATISTNFARLSSRGMRRQTDPLRVVRSNDSLACGSGVGLATCTMHWTGGRSSNWGRPTSFSIVWDVSQCTMRYINSNLVRLLLFPVLVTGVIGIGQNTCVTFRSTRDSFTVVSGGAAAPVLLSADEWPGVQRAASDFASDIKMVTGVTTRMANTTAATITRTLSTMQGTQKLPIIVGTLGKSSLISAVIQNAKLDVSSISGQWESFLVRRVTNPFPGVPSALVVIGADKRGTIFAMYDLSEQFGVSPWFWWADVPTTPQRSLFVDSTGCSHGSPTVKYRGIFLNDEQPALQNWAMEKFTNGTGATLTGSPFNHFFYTKLWVGLTTRMIRFYSERKSNRFELILRLKGNYLWPGTRNTLRSEFSLISSTIQLSGAGEMIMASLIVDSTCVFLQCVLCWRSTESGVCRLVWRCHGHFVRCSKVSAKTLLLTPFHIPATKNRWCARFLLNGICLGRVNGTTRRMRNLSLIFGWTAQFEQNHSKASIQWVCVVTATVYFYLHLWDSSFDASHEPEPLSTGQNIDLLEKIVADQREILGNVFNGTDISTIPQVWTLCELRALFLRHWYSKHHGDRQRSHWFLWIGDARSWRHNIALGWW